MNTLIYTFAELQSITQLVLEANKVYSEAAELRVKVPDLTRPLEVVLRRQLGTGQYLVHEVNELSRA